MFKGTVKWFAPQRGYGFISGDDGKEYFVYFKDIVMEGYKTLSQGEKVTFDTKNTEKGVAACNVSVIKQTTSDNVEVEQSVE